MDFVPSEAFVINIKNMDRSTTAAFSEAFKNDYTQFPAKSLYSMVRGGKRITEVKLSEIKGRIMILSDSLSFKLGDTTMEFLGWSAAFGDQ